MTYKVGDFTVYRLFSLCKIEEIETPSFETDSTKQYYKLRPVFDNKSDTTVYIPLSSEDSLRPLFHAENVRAALNALPRVKANVTAAKKPQQQATVYQELLATCSVENYLLLLKSIHLKEKSNAKRLSEIDVRFRAKIERILCEEFSILFEETPELSKQRIYQSMEQS